MHCPACAGRGLLSAVEDGGEETAEARAVGTLRKEVGGGPWELGTGGTEPGSPARSPVVSRRAMGPGTGGGSGCIPGLLSRCCDSDSGPRGREDQPGARALRSALSGRGVPPAPRLAPPRAPPQAPPRPLALAPTRPRPWPPSPTHPPPALSWADPQRWDGR